MLQNLNVYCQIFSPVFWAAMNQAYPGDDGISIKNCQVFIEIQWPLWVVYDMNFIAEFLQF